MRYCPRCLTDYPEDAVVCWPCRWRLVSAPAPPPEAWEVVYAAPDEFSALTLEAVLADAGIDVLVRSEAAPWITGIMAYSQGYWGRLLVHPEAIERARDLVRDYLAALED